MRRDNYAAIWLLSFFVGLLITVTSVLWIVGPGSYWSAFGWGLVVATLWMWLFGVVGANWYKPPPKPEPEYREPPASP